MIVTAHQPNFLPGASVLAKLARADSVIWLDGVQYTKGGFVNRNRMPDGSWLTVPIERATDGLEIRKVRIVEGGWRRRAAATLEQRFGPALQPVCAEIARPYRMLIALNLSVLQLIARQLELRALWHFQTHLDSGRAVRAVSENARELLPISERLAMMTAELGGETYLSGPSGRGYLDERPFLERGLEVRYFEWGRRPNPCAAALLADRDRLAA